MNNAKVSFNIHTYFENMTKQCLKSQEGHTVTDETLHFTLTDGTGRVVLANTEQVASGDFDISLDGTILPSGMYILSCSSITGTKRLHVIKI